MTLCSPKDKNINKTVDSTCKYLSKKSSSVSGVLGKQQVQQTKFVKNVRFKKTIL